MKISKIIWTGSAICTLLLGIHTPPSEATPISFGSHYYEIVVVTDPFVGNNNSWEVASAEASSRVYNGMSGHLATITTQAENDFLFGLTSDYSFTGFAGAWLGGKAGEGWLVGPENGQDFGFTNWGGGEPNNSGLAYMNIGSSYAGINPGKWADDSGVQGYPDSWADPVVGYFVEYEGAAPVPEPATMLLFGTGLAGLAGIRIRKKSKK